jgi:hypothetical protein
MRRVIAKDINKVFTFGIYAKDLPEVYTLEIA